MLLRAPCETRTHTVRTLIPVPLPIGPRGHCDGVTGGARTHSKRITTSCASQYTTATVRPEGIEPTTSSVSWMRSAD